MSKLVVQSKIKKFNKVISVDADKSLSIRSLLIGSQSYGICKIKNISKSGDTLSTIEGLRKLGIKIVLQKKKYLLSLWKWIKRFFFQKKYFN